MQIINKPSELQPAGSKVCVGIGVFDGVHLGHQQVIRQTVTDARQREALGVVITFDRHPNAVVAPDRVPPLIYSIPQKLRAIAELGVDATWLIAFDESFSQQTGEQVIRRIAGEFGHLLSICVGREFTFGHRRSGNVPMLEKLGDELQFAVHGLSAVSLDGQVVSSTRIREAIQNGQLNAAGQMLGRAYGLEGVVIGGDQLGRKLGFPTANLELAGRQLPPFGVYAAHTFVDGHSHRAVVNIGTRPTVGGTADPRVEVHLLDFDQDLYGKVLEINFVQRLREEQKFPSLDALQARIRQDVADARDLFSR